MWHIINNNIFQKTSVVSVNRSQDTQKINSVQSKESMYVPTTYSDISIVAGIKKITQIWFSNGWKRAVYAFRIHRCFKIRLKKIHLKRTLSSKVKMIVCIIRVSSNIKVPARCLFLSYFMHMAELFGLFIMRCLHMRSIQLSASFTESCRK